MISWEFNRWESKRYTAAAEWESCVICGAEDQTVVFCHLPHTEIGYPAGTGGKTHDFLGADCCSSCHYELDHGKYRNDFQVRMKAFAKTIERRLRSGILMVEGTMSEMGDMREALERVQAMRPLTEREKELAVMNTTDADGCIAGDMVDDPDWWGEDAISAYKYLFDLESDHEPG